jgi:hypothetical protein
LRVRRFARVAGGRGGALRAPERFAAARRRGAGGAALPRAAARLRPAGVDARLAAERAIGE